MIRFLLKGLIRDKSRSRLPVIVVACGVMLSVLLHSYITGVIGDSIELNAKFSTGHVKVMTKAYADNINVLPNDLALLEVFELQARFEEDYPDVDWSHRIQFGGLIDVPDSAGETKTQGPALGFGVDLLSENTPEIERMNLSSSLVRGNLPAQRGEILLSEDFSQKLKINPGEELTLISSTMYGGMAFYNFTVSGTIRFGTVALDRGTMVVDIEDVRAALDMSDATGEMLGFFNKGYYDNEYANILKTEFNKKYYIEADEYSPYMQVLRDQSAMAMYVDMAGQMTSMITGIFVLAMALVLWNAGLLGGLRRYGEFGVRLAIGEEKGHIYRTLIMESVMVGIVGSIIGTMLGLGFAWLLQTYGIDIGSMVQGSSIMIPSVYRARITPVDFYIGFMPGLIATVIGTMLAGIGIYKRQTAQLFKELEA